jgi:predicted transcriptional regulator
MQHGAVPNPRFHEELSRKLRRLGITTNRFAKMVGVAQNTMRMILIGANVPTPETVNKIESALAGIEACPACGRAFLDGSHDVDIQEGPKGKKK